jgi:type IV pilus assembly protein PilO
MGIRQFIFIMVLLAVPLASYFMVFKPQNAEIAKARTEIELKQAMLEKLRAATAKTADLETANAQIKQSIDAIESRLPSTKEIDTVLREVAVIAGKSGLKVPTFKKNDKKLPPGGLALEQPLDVEITGDFDGFYRFLQDLERIPRITKIQDMKISRQEEGDGNIKAAFTLTVYYQEPIAATASAESKGGEK